MNARQDPSIAKLFLATRLPEEAAQDRTLAFKQGQLHAQIRYIETERPAQLGCRQRSANLNPSTHRRDWSRFLALRGDPVDMALGFPPKSATVPNQRFEPHFSVFGP